MRTLVLTLPLRAPDAEIKYHYVLSNDGRSITRQACAPAALLPAVGQTDETVAVVPARALSWQRITLPRGALAHPQRLRLILEGLLEEHLLDDPTLLHFALPPGATIGTNLWVAVCDRAWLRDALQTLENAGHPASRVVPEIAPGSSTQARCTVIGSPEEAQALLTGIGPYRSATVIPLTAVPTLLSSLDNAIGGSAATNSLATLSVRAEPATAALAESVLGRPVQIQTTAQRMLEAALGHWDLAQLELASNGRLRALRKFTRAANTCLRAPQWRAARWALGIVAMVQIIGINAWAWQERRTLADKQLAVRNALTQTFAHVKVVVDAPLQMERELALLRSSSGHMSTNDLEPLMAAAAAVLPTNQQPYQIEYTDGILHLHGVVLNDQSTAALNHTLAAHGLVARMQGEVLLMERAPLPGDAR